MEKIIAEIDRTKTVYTGWFSTNDNDAFINESMEFTFSNQVFPEDERDVEQYVEEEGQYPGTRFELKIRKDNILLANIFGYTVPVDDFLDRSQSYYCRYLDSEAYVPFDMWLTYYDVCRDRVRNICQTLEFTSNIVLCDAVMIYPACNYHSSLIMRAAISVLTKMYDPADIMMLFVEPNEEEHTFDILDPEEKYNILCENNNDGEIKGFVVNSNDEEKLKYLLLHIKPLEYIISR